MRGEKCRHSAAICAWIGTQENVSRSFQSREPPTFSKCPMRGSVLGARQAHNLKVVGSNPTPATKFLESNQSDGPPLAGFSLSDSRFLRVTFDYREKPCSSNALQRSVCHPVQSAPKSYRAHGGHMERTPMSLRLACSAIAG